MLLILSTVLSSSFVLMPAWAGPPFLTDDPEPVGLGHGELYLASQYSNAKDGVSMTLPHVEFNYGILPETQFHLIVPMAYSGPREGPKQYGPGDMELGVKYRFLKETENIPEAGIFPLAELPTGDSTRGLGERRVRIFLPLWLQKDFGKWTTYGGGGYWHNPGPDNKDYWFFGWEVQREISKGLTLGGELYHSTRSAVDDGGHTGFNIGMIVYLNDNHNILLSAGRDLHGDNLFQSYAAYLYTFGKK